MYLYFHKTYDHVGWPLPIKSNDPLNKKSCEIMWQTKTIISSLPQCPWPPNLGGWWLTFRSSYPSCYSTLWSCSLARLCNRLRLLYLHYHNVHGSKTWQGVWLTMRGSHPWSYIALWPCDLAKSCDRTKAMISPLTRSPWP